MTNKIAHAVKLKRRTMFINGKYVSQQGLSKILKCSEPLVAKVESGASISDATEKKFTNWLKGK